MKRFLFAILFLFQITAADNLQAEQLSVGDFIKSCALPEGVDPDQLHAMQMVQFLRCVAYIDGITDGLVIAMTIDESMKLFCLPTDGLPMGGSLKMIRDFIISKKVSHDKPVRGIVAAAFASYFPCS